MTLYDLTKHESGFVVYPNGETIVCNWMVGCPPDNSLPTLGPLDMLMFFPQDEELGELKEEPFEDILDILDPDNLEILLDDNDDMSRLFNDGEAARNGIMYRLKDGTRIFTISDWC